MSKVPKFIVIVAGLLGLGGFFLPMLTVDVAVPTRDLAGTERFTASYSGLQLATGAHKAKDTMESAGEAAAAVGGDVGEAGTELAANSEALGNLGIALAAAPFAPSALLFLLGLAGLFLGFRRGSGATALMTGLIAIGVMIYGSKLAGSTGAGVAFEGPAWILVGVSAALAIVGGVWALIKPEQQTKLGALVERTSDAVGDARRATSRIQNRF